MWKVKVWVKRGKKIFICVIEQRHFFMDYGVPGHPCSLQDLQSRCMCTSTNEGPMSWMSGAGDWNFLHTCGHMTTCSVYSTCKTIYVTFKTYFTSMHNVQHTYIFIFMHTFISK